MNDPNNGSFGKVPSSNVPSATSSPQPKAPTTVGSGSDAVYPESTAALKALNLPNPITNSRPKGV